MTDDIVTTLTSSFHPSESDEDETMVQSEIRRYSSVPMNNRYSVHSHGMPWVISNLNSNNL